MRLVLTDSSTAESGNGRPVVHRSHEVFASSRFEVTLLLVILWDAGPGRAMLPGPAPILTRRVALSGILNGQLVGGNLTWSGISPRRVSNGCAGQFRRPYPPVGQGNPRTSRCSVDDIGGVVAAVVDRRRDGRDKPAGGASVMECVALSHGPPSLGVRSPTSAPKGGAGSGFVSRGEAVTSGLRRGARPSACWPKPPRNDQPGRLLHLQNSLNAPGSRRSAPTLR